MSALEFRTRASVLWVTVAVAMVGALLLMVFLPGRLEELLAGEMEGEALTDGLAYVFAAMGAFPLVMAAATLLVGERVNRWMNLIAGLAFGGYVGVYGLIAHLAMGPFNAHTLMGVVAGALAFLIAGLAAVGLRRPAAVAPAYEEERPREKATV